MRRLLDCHERIRSFLASAERLSGGNPAPDDEVTATASALVRYFEEALPRHSEDEELSIRPRLAAAGFVGHLDALGREHDTIDIDLDRLLTGWHALAEARVI